jgi:hypothetical protein
MEKDPQDAEHEQSGDPEPETDDAGEYAERQQEEEETRGHGPADGSSD